MSDNQSSPIPKAMIVIATVLIAIVVSLAITLTTEGFGNYKILLAILAIMLGVLLSSAFLLIAFKSKSLS